MENIGNALVLALSFCMVASATNKPIDIHNSTIRIHVGKGVACSPPQVMTTGSRLPLIAAALMIAFIVRARNLMVEPDKDVSAETQAEVQRTMQEKVLESDRYPEISFRSSSVEKTTDDSWIVSGVLMLHGHSNRVSSTVRRVQSKYVGRCQIKQTDFGIEPVRAGGGLVRVKNELDIEFAITAAQAGSE